jgi:hypothetical protein
MGQTAYKRPDGALKGSAELMCGLLEKHAIALDVQEHKVNVEFPNLLASRSKSLSVRQPFLPPLRWGDLGD